MSVSSLIDSYRNFGEQFKNKPMASRVLPTCHRWPGLPGRAGGRLAGRRAGPARPAESLAAAFGWPPGRTVACSSAVGLKAAAQSSTRVA